VQQAAKKVEFVRVKIDPARNDRPIMACDIANEDSRARILAIRAEED
jgi:acetate kinase